MRILRLAGSALAVVMAAAGVAWAGGGTPGNGSPMELPLDGETTAPDWLRQPSNEDLQRTYPPLAQYMKLRGGATIGCEVETDGRLDDCHILSEWPAGIGFGAAAVRSTAYMMMKPATKDGRPVVGMVKIPLKFQLGRTDADQAQPDAAPAPTSPGALVAAREVISLQDAAGRLRAVWRPNIDRLAAQTVFNGQAQSSTAAVDAFRQGLDEAIAFQVDRQAHVLASKMTQADLQATVAYLRTPAGKAWTAADASPALTPGQGFINVLSSAARKHLCAQANCNGPDATSDTAQSASR